jgi:hypothetical protein
VAKILFRP